MPLSANGLFSHTEYRLRYNTVYTKDAPFNISQGFLIIMDNIKNDVKWQKNTMHLSKLNFFGSLHRWNCCYQLNSHSKKDLSHNCIKLGKHHKRKMNRLIKKIQKLFIYKQYKTIFKTDYLFSKRQKSIMHIPTK